MSIWRIFKRPPAARADEVPADVREVASRISAASLAQEAPDDARERARSRMRLAVAEARATPFSQPQARGSAFGRRLVLAGGLAALMLLVTAGALNVLDNGAGPLGSPSAEAVVIEGTVESAGAGTITLITASGSQVISLDGSTQVVDSLGNLIRLDSLLQGERISVKGRRDEQTGLVIEEVKAVDEVHGTVVSLTATALRVTTSRGDFELVVTPQTEFDGTVGPGVFVEVDIEPGAGGTLIAEKVEVEDDERKDDDSSGPGSDDDRHDDDDDRSGPGGGDDGREDDDHSGPGGGDDDDDH
jgi:hypothetical protein